MKFFKIGSCFALENHADRRSNQLRILCTLYIHGKGFHLEQKKKRTKCVYTVFQASKARFRILLSKISTTCG